MYAKQPRARLTALAAPFGVWVAVKPLRLMDETVSVVGKTVEGNALRSLSVLGGTHDVPCITQSVFPASVSRRTCEPLQTTALFAHHGCVCTSKSGDPPPSAPNHPSHLVLPNTNSRPDRTRG